jgi:hypothetical protein
VLGDMWNTERWLDPRESIIAIRWNFERANAVLSFPDNIIEMKHLPAVAEAIFFAEYI